MGSAPCAIRLSTSASCFEAETGHRYWMERIGPHYSTSAIEAEGLGKAFRLDDATGRYIVFLKQTFPRRLSLDGLKIGLDCAHGAAYKVAPLVFRELGAEVFTLGDEPDGRNINYRTGALHPESMCEAVRIYRRAHRMPNIRVTGIDCHIGSQITNIRAVKDALREASRIFVELHTLGAPVRYLDCGGGLGVDYTGSGSTHASSMNYDMAAYASTVVGKFAAMAQTHMLPVPDLFPLASQVGANGEDREDRPCVGRLRADVARAGDDHRRRVGQADLVQLALLRHPGQHRRPPPPPWDHRAPRAWPGCPWA